MELIDRCYQYLFWGTLVVLGLCILIILLYIITSRLTVDRIIGINLIGTIAVIAIALLTYLLREDYLADIALLYVVLSFLSVTMLCKLYIDLYARRNDRRKEDDAHDR